MPIWKKITESIKDTNPESYKKAMKLYEGMEEPKDVVYYSAPVILFVIGPVMHACKGTAPLTIREATLALYGAMQFAFCHFL